jgi:hypothetical protein
MFRYFRQFVSMRTRARHLQAHPCLVTPARSSLGTSLIFQVLAGHWFCGLLLHDIPGWMIGTAALFLSREGR